MKKLGRWLGLPAIAVLGLMSSPAEATFIAQIVNGAGTPTNGSISNVNLTGFNYQDVDNDDTATTPNAASFDVSVTGSGNFNADVAATGPFPAAGDLPSPNAPFTEYQFVLSVTNNTGAAMNFFDVAVTGVQNMLGIPDFDVDKGSGGDTPHLDAQRITDQHIRFNFAGLGLGVGDTTSLTFYMDIPDGSTELQTSNPAFSLTFATVPEPASMALAGLACCGIGGLVRRRRKAAAVKTEVA